MEKMGEKLVFVGILKVNDDNSRIRNTGFQGRIRIRIGIKIGS
jgi:hypothetical protein